MHNLHCPCRGPHSFRLLGNPFRLRGLFCASVVHLHCCRCFLAFSTGTAAGGTARNRHPAGATSPSSVPPHLFRHHQPSSFKAPASSRRSQHTFYAGIPSDPSGFLLPPPARIAAMNNDDVPAPLGGVAAADEYLAAAARRGGFPDLRNRRLRAAFFLAVWGAAGIIYTTVPNLSANADHVMLYFVLLMAAVFLLLLSMAGVDLPWLEWAAARLEDMFQF